MKPQTTHESGWPFLIGMVVLLGLIVIVALVLMSMIASDLSLRPAPAIPASAVPASATPQTTLYPAIPFLTFLPPIKQTFAVAGEQTRQAEMLTATFSYTPVTPFHIAPAQYTYVPEPFPTGIFNNQAAPIPVKDFTIYNLWENMVNGERVTVYAGFKQDGSGRIVVHTATADGSNKLNQAYDPPPGIGRLQVMAAAGDRLTLQDDQGHTLYFDVPTRQFVDSLTATVTGPTTTPLPTWVPPTPTPTALSTAYLSTAYP